MAYTQQELVDFIKVHSNNLKEIAEELANGKLDLSESGFEVESQADCLLDISQLLHELA